MVEIEERRAPALCALPGVAQSAREKVPARNEPPAPEPPEYVLIPDLLPEVNATKSPRGTK
jgi:hypothetical protein